MRGSDADEVCSGKIDYHEVLRRIHREVGSKHYLEIGVRHGRSLALAMGPATGIDPTPELQVELPHTTEIIRTTSDQFFSSIAGNVKPDLCFIDGMHLFEFALRDFINFERHAAPGAVVIVDDVLPNNVAQAARKKRTAAWTGDVWRVIETLRDLRDDLFVITLDTFPTGLALITGLDSGNEVLKNAYPLVVRDSEEPLDPPPRVVRREHALDPRSSLFSEVLASLTQLRESGAGPSEIVGTLRGLIDDRRMVAI